MIRKNHNHTLQTNSRHCEEEPQNTNTTIVAHKIFILVVPLKMYILWVEYRICLFNVFQDDPEPTKCLGVFGLSLYTQERDLREVFNRYGPLEDCNVVYDRQVSPIISTVKPV